MKFSSVHFLMVLTTLQSQIWSVQMQSPCRFRFIREPAGQTLADCNLIGSGASISCNLGGDEAYNVEWHFTQNSDQAGINGILITPTSNGYNLGSTFQVIENVIFQNYTLNISKLGSATTGYYWCSVKLSQRTPSQVVHIEEQCSVSEINSCPTTTSLSQSSPRRCADDPSQDISIVNAQNLTCPKSTPKTDAPTQQSTTTKKVIPTTVSTTIFVPTTLSTTTVTEHKPITIANTDTTVTSDNTGHKSTTLLETISTSEETTISSSQATDETSTIVDNSEGVGEFSIDVIWLVIGVVLALLLLGVIILLAVIAVLQCKKRRIKRVASTSHRINAYAESGESTGIVLREFSRETNKKRETESEPEYAEIPVNLIKLGTPNPLFSSQESPTQQRDAPFSPVSVQYEDVNVERQGQSVSPVGQYETIEPPEYSRLEHSGSINRPNRPSTSSSHFSTQGQQSHIEEERQEVIQEEVFDEPLYAVIDSSPAKSSSSPPTGHVKVHISKSAPDDEYSQLDGDGCHSAFSKVPPPSCSRKLSYDSSIPSNHTYTPVQPSHPKQNNYTFPIVNTEEKYISEQGHLYHVLESSLKSQADETEKSGDNPRILADGETKEEPLYHVLEESLNTVDGPESNC